MVGGGELGGRWWRKEPFPESVSQRETEGGSGLPGWELGVARGVSSSGFAGALN